MRLKHAPPPWLLAVFLAVWALGWAIPALSSTLSDQEREYLGRKVPIVFISQTNYPPFEFVEPDGSRAGMCIELARWMATTLGFQARFLDSSFKEAQEAVLSGRADVLTSLFHSEKRAQAFDFTQMTFEVPASIFVAAERPDIKDVKDLDGKAIAMQSGDYAQEFLESRGLRFQVAWTPDFAQATDLVIAGQADAVIGDEQIVLYHLYSHQLTQRVKKVGNPLYVGRNCMAVKAGDSILRGILDKGLAQAKASGTLEQINRKWLGVQYLPQPSLVAKYRPYMLAAAGAMMLLSLLIWIWNLQLRRLVRRRTADLAESEAKYRALIETTDTGFVILDQAGRVLDANQEYVRLTGRGSLTEIRGLPVVEWTHPQDMERNQAEVEKCLSLGLVRNLEIRYLLPDGSELPVEINATVVESASQTVILSVCRDITERKRAEAALRASEEVKDLLLNASPDPFFLMDTHGVILLANRALGQRLDKSMDELVGVKAFDLLPPEVAARRRHYFDLALASGQPNEFEDQWRGRHMHFRHIPILDAQGRVVEMAVFSRDITPRVLAEEALRKSEGKHRLVLEESTDPIFSFLPDGTYSYVNKAFATPFGKRPGEIIGKRIWDIFPQDEADKRFAAVKAVFESGQTRVIEVRVPQPVEDLYFVTSVKPVKDQEGRVLTVICISKDITQRKKAEEALKESVERFRVISEESPLGISLLDHGGRYEYVNPAFVKIFGYTLEEVPTGEAWFDLVYPDPEQRRQAKEDWREDLQRYPAGEARPRTYQVRCKDLSRKTILFRPVTIASGRQVVIYEDVTERLEAERALKESERRYRELFDGMSDLIYTQDLEGRFLSVNPALAKAFGYTPQDLLGHKASDFMKAEFREAYQKEYLGKLRREGHHFGLSLYFARDGNRRYIEYHSALVSPPDGPGYISGVGRDVTERIMAERQLRRLQEQLFQSQKIEALGVLAGGIAHDFNNVLQAISGYTQLMLSEKDRSAPDRDRLEHVEQFIVRATGMIRHLMTLARKGQTHLERVDLNQEVARTVKILEHTLPRMIKIVTDLAPDLWPISADSTQVEQVLLNLSTNAGQAMPQGGELAFSTRNLTLGAGEGRALSGLGPGDFVCLKVSDTGAGMDEETISHIFEPFFTTKPRGQGTGLGLSSVYGIVTNYGGRIHCDSLPQRGTTFAIYLPVAPAPAPAEIQEPCPPVKSVAGSETVLVVDDEAAILDTCRQALQECGYGVLTAASGEEALDIYLSSPQAIGLVILDLSMPGMGGIKCLQTLLAARPQARVLVATGYADEAVTRQIGQLGAAGLIGKPYRFHELLAQVRAILDAGPSSVS